MSDFIVRHVANDDLAGIMELERDAFPLDPYTQDMVMKRFSEYPEGCWVATRSNMIVGYIASWLIRGMPRIDTLAVHKEYRRSGIGTLLVTKSLRHFAEKGFSSIELELRPTNIAALKLYKKLQFREVGVKKAYYDSDGSDALVMRKALRG